MQPKLLLIDLTDAYTNLVITGPQAETFLQGQVTCDVKAISENNSTLGAYCNLKGRMVSFFRIYRQGDAWHLILPTDLVEIAENALKHYARFSKVTIMREQPCRIGLIDPSPSLRSTSSTGGAVKDHTLKTIEHLGNRVEYIGSAAAIAALQQTLLPETQPGTLEAWHLAQINAGEAFLTPATSGEFLPHDINLPQLGGVSFTKGCFLGQEIIARMEYLGKLKKQMHQVTLPTQEKIICSAGHQALVI